MSALTYSKLLGSRKISSLCLTYQDSPLGERCSKEQVPVRLISQKESWLGKVRALRAVIKSQKVRTVFVHRTKDLSILRAALIGLQNVEIIGFAHMLLNVSKRDPWHAILYSRFKKFVTFTKVQKQLLAPKLPLKDEQYEIIHPGVDCQRFHPSKRDQKLRDELGASENDCLIGVVGRFDRQKGQLEFVQALKILDERGLNFRAALVGAPTIGESQNNYNDEVINTVMGTSLEPKVKFVGFLQDTSVLMASLDIFVLPSYQETFGLVVLEAMASGATTLVTNAGGPPEITDEPQALFEPRDPTSLAQTLSTFIQDANLRKKLSKTMRERACLVFDKDRFADDLARLSATQSSKS